MPDSLLLFANLHWLDYGVLLVYLAAMLARGAASLHLDPRVAGVELPEVFRPLAYLVLPLRTPHGQACVVDEHGVRGACLLEGAWSNFAVPWAAVFAMVSEAGEFVAWPADLPAESLRGPGCPREAMQQGRYVG